MSKARSSAHLEQPPSKKSKEAPSKFAQARTQLHLSAHPKRLVCREKEQATLRNFILDAIKSGEGSTLCMCCYRVSYLVFLLGLLFFCSVIPLAFFSHFHFCSMHSLILLALSHRYLWGAGHGQDGNSYACGARVAEGGQVSLRGSEWHAAKEGRAVICCATSSTS